MIHLILGLAGFVPFHSQKFKHAIRSMRDLKDSSFHIRFIFSAGGFYLANV